MCLVLCTQPKRQTGGNYRGNVKLNETKKKLNENTIILCSVKHIFIQINLLSIR